MRVGRPGSASGGSLFWTAHHSLIFRIELMLNGFAEGLSPVVYLSQPFEPKKRGFSFYLRAQGVNQDTKPFLWFLYSSGMYTAMAIAMSCHSKAGKVLKTVFVTFRSHHDRKWRHHVESSWATALGALTMTSLLPMASYLYIDDNHFKSILLGGAAGSAVTSRLAEKENPRWKYGWLRLGLRMSNSTLTNGHPSSLK